VLDCLLVTAVIQRCELPAGRRDAVRIVVPAGGLGYSSVLATRMLLNRSLCTDDNVLIVNYSAAQHMARASQSLNMLRKR